VTVVADIVIHGHGGLPLESRSRATVGIVRRYTPLVSEYELAPSLGQLAQDQIRIFTVGFEKCGDKGTDHIDLHMMFSRPVEGGLCQG